MSIRFMSRRSWDDYLSMVEKYRKDPKLYISTYYVTPFPTDIIKQELNLLQILLRIFRRRI